MALKDTFGQLFSKRTETSEQHALKELKTRYYKTTKDKALEAAEKVIQEQQWTVKRVEAERGEIVATSLNGKNLFIVTVITVKPFRTAVDVSCSIDTVLPSDFGQSRKAILAFYKALDQNLTYVGSGLGDELS